MITNHSSNGTPEVSIVIPSYRDATRLRRNLPGYLEWLGRRDWPCEVVLSDDGGQDGLLNVANDFGIAYVGSPKNQGKGAAVRRAMLQARGVYRLFTDADIPFHFDAIDEVLCCLRRGYDLAVGNRTLPQSVYHQQLAPMRALASRAFSAALGVLLHLKHADTQCGLKGFRGSTADLLFRAGTINGFAFDVEIIFLSVRANLSIAHIPVRLRSHEGSSVKLLRDSVCMFKDLLRIWLRSHVGKYDSALHALRYCRAAGQAKTTN